jgi:outer membrane immunogenic protein
VNKIRLLAVVAVGFAFASFANAADLRMPLKAEPAAIAAFNWTGYYIGASGGAAWTKADVGLNPVNGAVPNYRPEDIPGVAALGTTSLNGTSAIFGAKTGYNFQFSSWVAGLEADFSYFHTNRSVTAVGNPFPAFAGSMALNTSVTTDWLATIRPRIGYAFDRTLIYATGGVAFGKVKFSNTDVEFAFNGAGFGNEASSSSQTRVGWAVGGGFDYALTRNWIVSAEYLHVDLGSISASGLVTSGNAATATLNFSTKLRSDIGRVAIAYKF